MRILSFGRDRTPPSRALLSGVGRWLAGLLLLLPAGCDLREIAAPNPVWIPRGPAPRAEAAPVLLGEYRTPIEVADGPSTVTTYQPARLALPLPANSYVLLRVSGRVRLVSGPWWPGPPRPIATYTAVQTTEATSRARTRVWIRGGSATAPPSGGYEPRFAPAPDGDDRIVLVRTGDLPDQLWTGRDLGGYLITATQGWCIATPWCSPSEIAQPVMWADRKEIEAYHVAESNTVTAMAIPEPLILDGPESVAPGQPATMNVRTWGGLRLRHPQILVTDTADVEWRWFPGDTAAVRNPTITGQRLSCTGKECTFMPGTAGGRMSMATWVEGARVETDRIVRVQQQELQLTCDQYLLDRGATLSCSAAAVPSGTLDSIQWEFADTAGNTVRDTSGAASWVGTMVVSGKITVAARLDGSPVADDTVVVVRARRWPRINVVAADSGNGHLPTAPRRYSDLADTHSPYPMQPYVTARVSSGPNAGMWYLKDPIQTVTANVHISDGFKPGSAFYAQQHSGTDPATGDPFCARWQVSAIERGAREHEGLIPSALTSHVEVFQQWFRTNAPQNSMEAVTGRDEEFTSDWTFSDKVTQEYILGVADPAFQDPNQKHTTDNPPGLVAFPVVPCRLRF